MKKMTCFLLVLTMLCVSCLSVALGAEYVTASPWTDDLTVDYNDTIVPTYASAYYGLFYKDVEVGEGETRSYAFYTPETYIAAGSCVYVVAPDGYTAEAFANESSWMQVAYDNGITVAFLESVDGRWDLDNLENELAYMTAVAAALSLRDIVNYNESSIYVVGYGEGSTVANHAAMNMANFFAGAVMMGTPAASEEMIATVGDTCIFDRALMGEFAVRLEGLYLKDVRIPVWIVNDNTANEALEAYWKAANDTLDEGLRNEYGTVYNQNERFLDQSATYEALSHVWVSDMEGASENLDYDFTNAMWQNFLSKRIRLRAQQHGTLYYNSIEQMNAMTYYTEALNGLDRYWAVYTPASYDGSEALPVVFFAHGHAHGIAAFFVNTGLWRTAEKYDFILVFGLGQPCGNDPLVSCYSWGTSGDSLEVELAYIDMMFDSVKAEYNVDSSRVYGIGHSNGTQLLLALAEYRTELFAGFAPIGNASRIYASVEDIPAYAKGDLMYPMTFIFGENEKNGDYTEGSRLDITIKRAQAANNIATDAEPIEYHNGKYLIRTFYNLDNLLPMVRHYILDDTIHTVLPEFCEIAWDAMSAYSRGEDGALYFNGVAVK